jgi:hypothetical protein
MGQDSGDGLAARWRGALPYGEITVS